MKKLLLIFALLLFPCSLQAKPENEAEKVCFCHNINHNPHTICTANQALVNAHMDHVNGNVPGVLDSLGECSEEGNDDGNVGDENTGDDGTVDGNDGDTGDDGSVDDDDGDTGDDGTDGDTGDDDTGGDNSQGGKDVGDSDSETLPQINDESSGGTAGGPGMLFEGSGCSLNRGPTQPAISWAWLAPLLIPMVFAGARNTSKAK